MSLFYLVGVFTVEAAVLGHFRRRPLCLHGLHHVLCLHGLHHVQVAGGHLVYGVCVMGVDLQVLQSLLVLCLVPCGWAFASVCDSLVMDESCCLCNLS